MKEPVWKQHIILPRFRTNLVASRRMRWTSVMSGVCIQWYSLFSGVCLMRLLIALLLPWLAFFTIYRPIAGIVCLILQITLIGWIPAAIWAGYAGSQYHNHQN